MGVKTLLKPNTMKKILAIILITLSFSCTEFQSNIDQEIEFIRCYTVIAIGSNSAKCDSAFMILDRNDGTHRMDICISNMNNVNLGQIICDFTVYE